MSGFERTLHFLVDIPVTRLRRDWCLYDVTVSTTKVHHTLVEWVPVGPSRTGPVGVAFGPTTRCEIRGRTVLEPTEPGWKRVVK